MSQLQITLADYQRASKQFFNKWNIQAFRDSGYLAVIHKNILLPPDSNQFNNIINCIICLLFSASINSTKQNNLHNFKSLTWINSFQICYLWLQLELEICVWKISKSKIIWALNVLKNRRLFKPLHVHEQLQRKKVQLANVSFTS